MRRWGKVPQTPAATLPFYLYVGTRCNGEINVSVRDRNGDDQPSRLPVRLDLVNHSPDGFEWGYLGSGPAQLAFALCLHVLAGDVPRARRVYRDVAFTLVSAFPEDAWSIDQTELKRAIEGLEQAQREELAGAEVAS